MTRSCTFRPYFLLLILSGFAAFGSAATRAATAADQAVRTGRAGLIPILTGATVTNRLPGTMTVTGEGFTPGGGVDLMVYDDRDASPDEIRSTTASRAFYGPNGSRDPAIGFKRGGVLSEAFERPCGATAMVRAYDRGMAAWSNWLNIDSTTAVPARYGPNGSADPAMGFRPDC